MAKEWGWGTTGDKLEYPPFLRLLNRRMVQLSGTIDALFSGQKLSQRAVTSAYTLTPSDFVLYVDATGGAVTVTLPDAEMQTGRCFVVMKTDSSGNAVTVDGDGSQTINGAATLAISSQYAVKWLQSNGSNWFVLSGS